MFATLALVSQWSLVLELGPFSTRKIVLNCIHWPFKLIFAKKVRLALLDPSHSNYFEWLAEKQKQTVSI